MALKGDRTVTATEMKFVAASLAMTAGGIVSVNTAASGNETSVSYAVNPSGAKPVGVLVVNVGDHDWTARPRFTDKSDVAFGEQLGLITIGQVRTNMVDPAITATVGEVAYLAASGLVSNVQASGALEVGQFMSEPDSDSYYYVDIRL